MREQKISVVTSEDIISMLENYRINQKKIELLKYELQHISPLSDAEVIEGMALRPQQGTGLAPTGNIADPTMEIASEYADVADRYQQELRRGISQELYSLEIEMGRLDHCISLLPEAQAHVIRAHYIEKRSWPEVQEAMGKTLRTLSEYRHKAIDGLTEMYQFLNSVSLRTQ